MNTNVSVVTKLFNLQFLVPIAPYSIIPVKISRSVGFA